MVEIDSSSRIQSDEFTLLSTLATKHNITSVSVSTYNVDVNDTTAFKDDLREVGEKHKDVTCMLFNAAKVATCELLKYSEEEMIEDFKVCVPFSSPSSVGLRFENQTLNVMC